MTARTAWQGKWLSVKTDGKWEYVSRVGGVSAVVILAGHDGRIILVEQHRVPLGRPCLELPAGLVGDEDPDATVETTAIKELEEETGFTGERVERLGDYYSSPGMVSEGFTLVRVHGVRPTGTAPEEGMTVRLVEREGIAAFVAAARARDVAIDVKLLALLGVAGG
ncbi:NUDIX hydrolase [Sphingomonas sp. ASV193]|uniref:NUDIX hydrolase n=1 Tax=Sphingomonas sp. ASV193 TaxID=3144405 RepID=UPI0032E91A7C